MNVLANECTRGVTMDVLANVAPSTEGRRGKFVIFKILRFRFNGCGGTMSYNA